MLSSYNLNTSLPTYLNYAASVGLDNAYPGLVHEGPMTPLISSLLVLPGHLAHCLPSENAIQPQRTLNCWFSPESGSLEFQADKYQCSLTHRLTGLTGDSGPITVDEYKSFCSSSSYCSTWENCQPVPSQIGGLICQVHLKINIHFFL